MDRWISRQIDRYIDWQIYTIERKIDKYRQRESEEERKRENKNNYKRKIRRK